MQHHTLVVGLCWAQWKERNSHHHQNWQWASDPLSSILFSHAIEPLNHHLATAFMELKCIQWKRWLQLGHLYAYDNLTPLALNSTEQPWPVLSRDNTGASSLNVNIAKTTAFRINTHPCPTERTALTYEDGNTRQCRTPRQNNWLYCGNNNGTHWTQVPDHGTELHALPLHFFLFTTMS